MPGESNMRRAVEFYSEGFKLSGDVYLPEDLPADERRAAASVVSSAAQEGVRFTRVSAKSLLWLDLRAARKCTEPRSRLG